jgi:hypothetical protein
LANDEAELRARGTSASREDLQRIEADLRRYSVRPIPRWAYGTTSLAASAVTMSPAFVPSSSRDEKVLALGLGLATAIPGAINLGIALATDNHYERYQKELLELRLSPIGPRGAVGLWATGSF